MTAAAADRAVRTVSYGQHFSRTDLPSVLPLETPLSLLIDPTNGCNFRCFFCPTGDPDLLQSVGRPLASMKWDLFLKIVDDVAAFPAPIKSIHLYKDGEPLVNPRLPDMVRLIKQRGLARRVEITTNGALLSAERADALLSAGLDGLRVSVYAVSSADYRRVTRRFDRFDTIVDNVAYLHRRKTELGLEFHIHCKMIDAAMTAEDRQRFIDLFGPISDSIYVNPLHGTAINDGPFVLTPSADRRVCSEPFIKMVININGAVSACCADWSHDVIVGDVSTTPLVDIWNGESLRALRLLHLEGRRGEMAACRTCTYVTTLPADNNLDHVRDVLLDRYRGPVVPAACGN